MRGEGQQNLTKLRFTPFSLLIASQASQLYPPTFTLEFQLQLIMHLTSLVIAALAAARLGTVLGYAVHGRRNDVRTRGLLLGKFTELRLHSEFQYLCSP
jgi:hypothetical protein